MSADTPVICAVLPDHPLLDTEAVAAADVGLPVVRFTFNDSLVVTSPPQNTTPTDDDVGTKDIVRFGIFRGFMLSDDRYAQLYNEFLAQHNIQLTTTPEQYSRAHYFPNSYHDVVEVLSGNDDHAGRCDDDDVVRCCYAPRACWCPVVVNPQNSPSLLSPSLFDECVARIRTEWTNKSGRSTTTKRAATHVMLKDYVKSAKPHFLKVPISSSAVSSRGTSSSRATSLQQHAVDFVHERGCAFNKGVVFKEHVPLAPTKNEWRLWFVFGELMSMAYNGENPDMLLPRQSIWSPANSGDDDDLDDDEENVQAAATTTATAINIIQQRPQQALTASSPSAGVVAAATRIARRIGCPYITIDFALMAPGAFRGSSSDSSEADDEDVTTDTKNRCSSSASSRWVCLEVGDGGVSGPAVVQDLKSLWRGLKRRFSPMCEKLGALYSIRRKQQSAYVVNIHSKVRKPFS